MQKYTFMANKNKYLKEKLLKFIPNYIVNEEIYANANNS